MRRKEMKSSVKDLVNLPRLEQAMDRAGVDAVVARAGLNFTYLAGFAYPGTLPATSTSWPTRRARCGCYGRARASRASC